MFTKDCELMAEAQLGSSSALIVLEAKGFCRKQGFEIVWATPQNLPCHSCSLFFVVLCFYDSSSHSSEPLRLVFSLN